MKRLVLFVMFIISAALASAAVNTAYYGKSPNIAINLASQNPDPVEPGNIVEVNFKLDNQGGLANDVVFEIMPEYPFSILPGENATKNVGTLGTAQDTVTSVFIKYKLRVDQYAVDGSHKIEARYKSKGFDTWVTVKDLKVKVQSKDAILSVEKLSTVPEIIPPGSKARLVIELKNYATSLLKDVKVVLELGKSGDEATPFAPLGSTNEKVIPIINGQASIPLEFDIVADPDAKSKVYKVPLTLKYSDILSKNHSKSLTLALVVGMEPELSAYIDTTSVYTAGKTGDVSIKIVNKGLSDIKFLNVRLDKSENYKVLSPYEVYIGNIDSDDYETADFKLSVERGSKDKVVMPLTVEYKDANNKDYTKKINLELPLYSGSEAKKLGLVKGTNKLVIFLVLLGILIVVFAAYRFRKKSKR